MKSLKMKLIYRKHKKAIWGALGAVLLAGLVFFFSYFHVTNVEVMGTTRYSDEEIKTMALQGAFTDNSVLAVLLHSRVDVQDVPFVEGFNITSLSHNSICVSVREKKAVGCIPYLDSYVYFDRNGTFIESSKNRDELVPFFDGIEVSHVIKGEKLPIKGSSVLTTAVALSTIFQKNNAIPDHIEFDANYQITLTYGDVKVMLGKDEYLEDKMTRVSAILPKLSGKKGILHLENVNDNSKTITFEQDLGEDGIIQSVDTAAAYENALANWHGGYDEEGDYTGEGEYDENLNYVGPKPTEESIAANGSWLGGYMEDGSYTGYGQLDKDGNYVGPNPNENSDGGDEGDTTDYTEDYSDTQEEDYNEEDYSGDEEEY
ncbi:cell division protein FtsQ/DivIB [Blautia sp. HCP3S3_H10_1]|uniref:cell division protein FtsQ/DivIB n=1 Tax=unclassified Blautia TaxID=2648079 RepID=UPI003F8EA756|nr:cell division protein FtsQ/DivIB [Clostridia bacterium]